MRLPPLALASYREPAGVEGIVLDGDHEAKALQMDACGPASAGPLQPSAWRRRWISCLMEEPRMSSQLLSLNSTPGNSYNARLSADNHFL